MSNNPTLKHIINRLNELDRPTANEEDILGDIAVAESQLSLKHLLEIMTAVAVDGDGNPDNVMIGCINIYKRKYQQTLDLIARTIETISCLPTSHDIRSAIEELASGLDGPLADKVLEMACARAVATKSSATSCFQGHTAYTREDLGEAEEIGFDAGYQECLEGKQRIKGSRTRMLDLE